MKFSCYSANRYFRSKLSYFLVGFSILKQITSLHSPSLPQHCFWSLSFVCFHTPPATDYFKGVSVGCHPSSLVLPTRITPWDSKISLTRIILLTLCSDSYIRPPLINENFQVLLHYNYTASISTWTLRFLPFPASFRTVQYKHDFLRLNYIFLPSILHLSLASSCFRD